MSFLFPKLPTQKIEGSRLSNLELTSSANGEAINVGVGTVRVSGNIIWGTPIREEKVESSSTAGGKGGGGQKTETTEYFYYCSFAVGLGQPLVDKILRMWSDGKVFFDDRASAVDPVRLDGLEFRLYRGTEEQMPDPLMEEDKGAGNVPAYRGLAYVVFDSLPLANFGNRVPNLTFEMVYTKAESGTIFDVAGPSQVYSGSIGVASTIVDWDRGYVYRRVTGGAKYRYARWLLSTLTFVDEQEVSFSGAAADDFWPVKGIDPITGHLVGNWGELSDLTDIHDFVWDPEAQAAVTLVRQDFSVALHLASDPPASSSASDPMMVLWLESDGGENAGAAVVASHRDVAAGGAEPSIRFHSLDTLTLVAEFTSPFLDEAGLVPSYMGRRHNFEFFVIWWNATRLHVFEYIMEGASSIRPNHEGAFDSTDFGDGADFDVGSFIIQPRFSFELDALFFVVKQTDGLASLVKWKDEGDIIWQVRLPAGFTPDAHLVSHFDRIRDRYLVLVDHTSNAVVAVSLDTGEVTDLTAEVNFNFQAGTWWWDGRSNCLYAFEVLASNEERLHRWCLRGGAPVDTDLQHITEEMCRRAALDPVLDIDASALAAYPIGGFVLADQVDAGEALVDLMDAFAISVVEYDGKIHFLPRGGAEVAALSESDLVLTRRGYRPYSYDVEEEIDLPEKFTIEFQNRAIDYQADQRATSRTLIPDPTVFTQQTEQIALDNVVLTSGQTKALSEILLYQRWAEAEQYEARLGRRQLALVPGDPVTLTLGDGTSPRLRLDRADIGADWTIKARLRTEGADQYTSDAESEDGSTVGGSTDVLMDSKGFVWGGPLLRDLDATARQATRLYLAASKLGAIPGTYPGAEIYQSKNGGSSYTSIARLLSGAPWGITRTALADPPEGYGVWDEDSTVDVAMVTGGDRIESLPDLDVLNGGNAAILFKKDGTLEYIQFATVTALGDEVYRLSRLLRGRRGTDTMAPGHASGETVLFVNRSWVEGSVLELAEINALYQYKPVTIGATLDDTRALTFGDKGWDLKPYEPVHVRAVLDEGTDNIDFTWIRRTRVGGEVWDYGDVPLSEDSEAYVLRIYASEGASTPLRTFNPTAEAQTYLAADITTDFGSTPASIWYEIAQVSAQVGEGFTRRRNVEVL